MFSNKTSAKLVAYHVTELAGIRRSTKHDTLPGTSTVDHSKEEPLTDTETPFLSLYWLGAAWCTHTIRSTGEQPSYKALTALLDQD